jgi:TolB-like protein/DNA-binding winged helix-turn-helix (wHTH) protein/rhodanese-related sulfurtransferase
VSKTLAIYQFGPFRLDPSRRQLTRDGVPVTLNSRAFEVLHLLARQQGGLVTRDEILAHVWRGVTVEENNLTVQISALRRALGDLPDHSPIIVTVPNQGYRLAGNVARLSPANEVPEVVLPATADAVAESPDAPPRKRQTPASPARAMYRWWPIGAVLCLALLAAGIAGSGALRAPPSSTSTKAPAAPRLSIVVLPFRNLSNDHRDDSLADAVSDDLTTELAHIPSSTVIARESADSYRGRSVPTDRIGRDLNVRYELEGSLRDNGDTLAVNAQLVEASTGAHLWAERFDVPRRSAAEGQASIARRLAGAVEVSLTQIEAARSLRERPNNPDALDLFLRARAIWDREESLESMKSARPLLERAIRMQPDFVEALAELGWQLSSMSLDFSDVPDPDGLAEAERVLNHALALARNDPRALAAQAYWDLAQGQFAAAEASAQAAEAIDPQARRAVLALYYTAFETAQWQLAYDLQLRLARIDPEGPAAQFRNTQLGYDMLMLGKPAEAVALMDRGQAGFPEPKPGAPVWDNIGSDRLFLVAALVESGDLTRAREIFVSDGRIWPYRTAFRVAGYFTKPQMRDPAVVRMFAALKQAGLPDYADEHHDDAIEPVAESQPHGTFDPTPMTVPNVRTIDTTSLAALVNASPPPLLVDMGLGIARPKGAVTGNFNPLSPEAAQHFVRALRERLGAIANRPVVVLGDGPYGWSSYNAVLQLQRAGLANLIWYRGGEEAWARAGLPSDDVRNP